MQDDNVEGTGYGFTRESGYFKSISFSVCTFFPASSRANPYESIAATTVTFYVHSNNATTQSYQVVMRVSGAGR